MGPTAETEEREAGPWGGLVPGRVGLWAWRPERSAFGGTHGGWGPGRAFVLPSTANLKWENGPCV